MAPEVTKFKVMEARERGGMGRKGDQKLKESNGREIYRINFLGTSVYEKWKLTPHITFVMMIKSEFLIYSNSVSALSLVDKLSLPPN